LKLSPVEKVTLAYIFITTVYLLVFFGKVDLPLVRFGIRVGVSFLILLLAWLCVCYPHPVVRCVRYFLPFALLSYWYPETYYIGEFIFPNMDQHLYAIEQTLFGCQPSLEFSEHVSWAWFSELMYFGYFSYYFIIFGTALWCYIRSQKLAQHAVFMFVGSFYLYYMVFIVFPVAGPQFYLDLFPPPARDGHFFYNVMRLIQSMGERPVGAFPSSHVSITFTVVIFIYFHCRQLLKFALPLFIILTFSTVYIKAHYVIDVIGGLASAGVSYPLMSWMYMKLRQRI
jgi:membrane-associated phospholipid phosphatase